MAKMQDAENGMHDTRGNEVRESLIKQELSSVWLLLVWNLCVFGLGALSMSEIFPLNMKGIGGSLVTLVNWFGSWAVSYAFSFLMNWSAPASATTILFVAKIVPETKGRSLEDIQESLEYPKQRVK